MRQLRLVLVVAVMLGSGAIPALAQERSEIDELIGGARRALNDLQYARADSIARSLLAMGSRATHDQRVVGFQLVAAALYPEERAAQKADSARSYLEDLVRATPDASVPAAISWPGLDSLVNHVRGGTFAVWANPSETYVLEGADAEARIDVSAARNAWFRLTATAISDGSSIVLDSAGPARNATLRIPALEGDRPSLPWGQYRLQILGIDSLTSETIELTYDAAVEAPPLLQHRVAYAPDSTLFLPERAPRKTITNALLGVALGAATAFTATAVGGSDDVGAGSGSGRAYVVGLGLSAGALIGALIDRGRPLQENIEHNAAVVAAFEDQARELRDENTRRRTEYRATITLQGRIP